MIGDEAVAFRKALEITYPVTEGVIKVRDPVQAKRAVSILCAH
jgi:hypothetical protein